MPAIGSVWGANTWGVNCWGANTWGSAVSAVVEAEAPADDVQTTGNWPTGQFIDYQFPPLPKKPPRVRRPVTVNPGALRITAKMGEPAAVGRSVASASPLAMHGLALSSIHAVCRVAVSPAAPLAIGLQRRHARFRKLRGVQQLLIQMGLDPTPELMAALGIKPIEESDLWP